MKIYTTYESKEYSIKSILLYIKSFLRAKEFRCSFVLFTSFRSSRSIVIGIIFLNTNSFDIRKSDWMFSKNFKKNKIQTALLPITPRRIWKHYLFSNNIL